MSIAIRTAAAPAVDLERGGAPVAAHPDPAGELRRALAAMATSVTLVTTLHEGVPYGFTANSFTSVSVSPPLVAVFLAETAECYAAFRSADRVAVNILAEGQDTAARRFSTKGGDKFADVELASLPGEPPVIAAAMAVVKGRVSGRWDAGDHLMLMIEVDGVRRSTRPPLVYQGREFRTLAR